MFRKERVSRDTLPLLFVERTGNMEAALAAQPWVPVNIGGSDLLAKVWFGDTQYRILLTDLSAVWEEEMSAEDIQSRAQELNKRLRAPAPAFFSHLCSVARPCFCSQVEGQISAAHVSLEHYCDNLTVRLKSELAGLPFHWEFHFSLTPVSEVCSQLVRPLLAMTTILQSQVSDLSALLARKDAEIQDYQENEAVLSRPRLQTQPFQVHKYMENFFTKNVPQMGLTLNNLHFDTELQALYMKVCSGKTCQKRPRSPKSVSSLEENHGPDQHPPEQQNNTEVASPPESLAQNEVKKLSGETQATDKTSPFTSPTATSCEKRSTSRAKKKKTVGLFL